MKLGPKADTLLNLAIGAMGAGTGLVVVTGLTGNPQMALLTLMGVAFGLAIWSFGIRED